LDSNPDILFLKRVRWSLRHAGFGVIT
jgi:hypothetical protein